MKKILMHACCAPCSIAPYKVLMEKGDIDVHLYWFNDNIHPFQEYKRRLDTFISWTEKNGISTIIEPEYTPETFLRRVVNRENERCFLCYYSRLQRTAKVGKKLGFDAFTSTLLYSVYQNHPLMIQISEELSAKHSIKFYYQDFRKLWKDGVELSKKEEMYRQPYCGCIFSEKDRYYKHKDKQ